MRGGGPPVLAPRAPQRRYCFRCPPRPRCCCRRARRRHGALRHLARRHAVRRAARRPRAAPAAPDEARRDDAGERRRSRRRQGWAAPGSFTLPGPPFPQRAPPGAAGTCARVCVRACLCGGGWGQKRRCRGGGAGESEKAGGGARRNESLRGHRRRGGAAAAPAAAAAAPAPAEGSGLKREEGLPPLPSCAGLDGEGIPHCLTPNQPGAAAGGLRGTGGVRAPRRTRTLRKRAYNLCLDCICVCSALSCSVLVLFNQWFDIGMQDPFECGLS